MAAGGALIAVRRQACVYSAGKYIPSSSARAKASRSVCRRRPSDFGVNGLSSVGEGTAFGRLKILRRGAGFDASIDIWRHEFFVGGDFISLVLVRAKGNGRRINSPAVKTPDSFKPLFVWQISCGRWSGQLRRFSPAAFPESASTTFGSHLRKISGCKFQHLAYYPTG
jgi:hypothetical protein